jgi:hypothetical protein
MSFEELLRRARKKSMPKTWSRSRRRAAARSNLLINKPPAMCATALIIEQLGGKALAAEFSSASAFILESFSATALVKVC